MDPDPVLAAALAVRAQHAPSRGLLAALWYRVPRCARCRMPWPCAPHRLARATVVTETRRLLNAGRHR